MHTLDQGAVFELPSLGLSNADNVLGNAVSSVRRARAAERGEAAIATSTGVFTQDEIDQLKRAFDSVDREESGSIPAYGLESVLRALGMEPIEEDIDALLAELGITMEGTIHFVEFCGVLARLKV
jgi:Ca2+-binding EF-hand superfamily protein